jgi:hypothetical protein
MQNLDVNVSGGSLWERVKGEAGGEYGQRTLCACRIMKPIKIVKKKGREGREE